MLSASSARALGPPRPVRRRTRGRPRVPSASGSSSSQSAPGVTNPSRLPTRWCDRCDRVTSRRWSRPWWRRRTPKRERRRARGIRAGGVACACGARDRAVASLAPTPLDPPEVVGVVGVLLSDDLFPAERAPARLGRRRTSPTWPCVTRAPPGRRERPARRRRALRQARAAAGPCGAAWTTTTTRRAGCTSARYARANRPRLAKYRRRRFIGVRLRGACALRGSRLRFERLRDCRGRALVRGDDNGAKAWRLWCALGPASTAQRRGGEKEKIKISVAARRVRRVRDGAGVLVRGAGSRARGGTPPRARSRCRRWCSRAKALGPGAPGGK